MNEFPHTDSKGTYYQPITLCKVQRISFWKLPRLFLFIIFIFYSYQPFKFWPTYFWSKSKVKTWIYCWYQYKVKFKYKAIQIFRDTPYNGLAQSNPMEAELYPIKAIRSRFGIDYKNQLFIWFIYSQFVCWATLLIHSVAICWIIYYLIYLMYFMIYNIQCIIQLTVHDLLELQLITLNSCNACHILIFFLFF